jgi:CubicO group peptidase (beta-lactamase class C family)
MRLDLSDEELVALFQDEPFDFAPGERFLYNNSGYYLLGMLIEAASGQSYRDYLNEHVFGALGLAGSSYCDERPIIPNRAEGYQIAGGVLVNDDPLSMDQPGAAGALCSTVLDLLSWSVALRSGDVVSAESYEQMATPATLGDGSATGYGFGLGIGELDGHASVAHGGGINGFNTMLAHYPGADLDVVALVNTNGPYAGRIAEVIAQWALGVEVVVVQDLSLSSEQLAVYEGVYELRPDFELSMTVREGQLFSQATGQGEFRLRAQGDHVFVPTFDDAVRVVFTVEDGRATGLVLHQGGQQIEAPRIR